MRNPLRYQLSEYDCGPTTMLNAVSYLFSREEISPEVIKNIMLYSLDTYGSEGIMGKRGTSSAAMMFLSNWLNSYGNIGHQPISSQYLSGKSVFLGEESRIDDALARGGVAVVRVLLEGGHYVLITGEEEAGMRVFDPYYEEEDLNNKDIIVLKGLCFSHNRVIPRYYFNRETWEDYAFGPWEDREAVLLFNEARKLTQEGTIEYFI
ncbi:MAG: peptidase C39 [Clostridia bacterium]|nr:C39 family peptidase [Lachnospiraceae bacterium]NCB99875.1 peptidase C39 [Clostridia bacterium]NCD02814.1 peptidase C39 [Clostridia bacterium]